MVHLYSNYFNGFYTLDLREKQFFLARLDDEFEIDVAYKAVIDHRNKYGTTEISDLEKAPPTITLDNDLALYKQQNSPYFWCRITLPKKNAGYARRSTKKKTISEASMEAVAIKIKTLAEFEAGTLSSQVKHTWGDVCHQTINQLKAEAVVEIKKGSKRPGQKDYASIIENHLLPFSDWKQKDIRDIEYPELMQMKKVFDTQDLGKTTATKRKTAIGHIFNYTKAERILTSSQIPDIPNFAWVGGDEGKPFDLKDRDIIIDNFHNFLESGRNNKITRHKRKLLPLYFNLLVLTGMRPGEEVMQIRWKDLSMGTFTINKKILNAVSLHVTSGKKSKVVKVGQKKEKTSRNFLIDGKAATTLEQLYYIRYGIEKTIHEIIDEKRDDIMFLGYEGRNANLEDSFKQYVSIYLKKKLSNYYTLYSARHEFINVKLEEGMDVADIAALCGNKIATIETYYMKFRSMMRAARILTDEDIKKFNPDPDDVKS
jgi:integrase